MKKSPLIYSLAPALLLSSHVALANTISGVIKDDSGKVLNQGSVHIMGTNKRVNIDENGRFEFSDVKAGSFELHVSSSNIIHTSQRVTVVDNQTTMVDIQVDTASIEILDVRGGVFHGSSIESAAPVSVLAGEKLQQQQASTLGETLKNQVGVHSSFYGSVVSSPIIRGLDGPRVLITQNGMDAADASRVGPDHLVSTESSTVEQIEILRGPATLFYGSGAIGGVVNMVDTRIPEDSLSEGEISISTATVNSEESFSGQYKTGTDKLAFQVLGFYRDNEDYSIPGFAESESAHDDHEEDDHDDDHDEDEHEEGSFGVVESSASRTKGLTLGTSYLFDNGHIGMSLEHLSSVYGIPGHAHEEEHEEEHDEEEHEEESVKADLQMNRYQLGGDFQISSELISAINFGISYTDYKHTELENQETGTRFSNELFETRIELLHQDIGGWRGGVSLHAKLSDFEAVGEEAFTPPSDTKSFSVGLIEEKHFGDFLVQLGARIEQVDVYAQNIFSPELEILTDEEHDEEHDDEHDDDHDDDHDEHGDEIGSSKQSFTPVSLSAGVVWDLAQGYNFSASYVYAQRAPSGSELFSFGPHIGTQSYEIGALYELEEHDGEYEFEFVGGQAELETSNNIDLSFRKFGGSFGVVANVFYNQVDNFYYAADTGLEASFEHAHEEEEHEEHEDDAEHEEEHSEEALPVFAYVISDAVIYGAELQLSYSLSENLTLMAQGDYTRAKLDGGIKGNLPRISPMKSIISAEYKNDKYSIMGQITHMSEQDKLAEYESKTDAYTLLDINASYYQTIADLETQWYLKGRNLLDEEARVHTSFLKDLAPLPGRSLELGVRVHF